MNNIELLEELKKLKAIADVGLLYAKNDYDKERYQELQEMSHRLLSGVSGHDMEIIKSIFPAAADYPTAKVDIRGLAISPENEILLVRESLDGKWSLPGGWADVGCSPKETIIKEFREETGLSVAVKALLAVFDKRFHAHPPQPFHVYKMVFYCELTSFKFAKGFDVLDIQYFAIDRLPELSEDRILKSQIELLYQKVRSSDFQAYVD
ncbi:NUDIX hydrolase N-terminal domain-containing protein [Pseudocnuella soli]|uniref:NUDIX hydrolase N-terminal domain-containing protein n=1 Tax=Pseudocnuella soli TaxID=2502779 RepID=UPI0010454761|nr:NUDIX hydrolase N-terminal domain-containing protein [Pseudocnuella soli]